MKQNLLIIISEMPSNFEITAVQNYTSLGFEKISFLLSNAKAEHKKRWLVKFFAKIEIFVIDFVVNVAKIKRPQTFDINIDESKKRKFLDYVHANKIGKDNYKESRFDCVLDLTGEALDESTTANADIVVSLKLDENNLLERAMSNIPIVSYIRLVCSGESGIFTVATKTSVFEIRRTLSEHFNELVHILPALLKRYERNKDNFIKTLPQMEPDFFGSPNAILLISKHLYTLFKLSFGFIINKNLWGIMLGKKGDSQFKYLRAKNAKTWADPLLYDNIDNGKLYLFFEEVLFGGKGRICAGEVDKNTLDLKNVNIVYEPKYHTSFPQILEIDEKKYLIIESSENNTLDLFAFEEFPHKIKLKRTLIANESVTDASVIFKDGFFWIFCTQKLAKHTSSFTNLSIYMTDNLLTGKIIPHKLNPIKCDARCSRGAGKILETGKKIIRPVQDCSTRYADGVRFYEITDLNADSYCDKLVESIYAEDFENIETFHTYSESYGILGLDGKYKTSRLTTQKTNLIERYRKNRFL